jgi:short subunit dehydrogenase-like uncharacterized protein
MIISWHWPDFCVIQLLPQRRTHIGTPQQYQRIIPRGERGKAFSGQAVRGSIESMASGSGCPSKRKPARSKAAACPRSGENLHAPDQTRRVLFSGN